MDCEVSCQTSGYVDCEASMKGGCEAQCTQPDGALFCNGSYVDTGNNLQNCIDALKAELNITATGSASCSGNQCQAEGQASASCAMTPTPARGAGSIAGLGLMIGALAWMRRRKA
jgi:MYXO-CTERM domain-containing protein